jgi:hypothetical protein
VFLLYSHNSKENYLISELNKRLKTSNSTKNYSNHVKQQQQQQQQQYIKRMKYPISNNNNNNKTTEHTLTTDVSTQRNLNDDGVNNYDNGDEEDDDNTNNNLKTSYSNEDEEIVMRKYGWLHKLSQNGLKLWRKRYFVLTDYILDYYSGNWREIKTI